MQGRKEGRKEGGSCLRPPSCKEASFAGTILPPSQKLVPSPSSPIEPALSTRDVWRWRSLINSKDRPRPPCGKLPSLLSVSPRLLLAPGLRRKEKNPIVALDRMEGVEKTHRSNRYFISLCLSLSLYLSLTRSHPFSSPFLYLQGNKSGFRRRVSRSVFPPDE